MKKLFLVKKIFILIVTVVLIAGLLGSCADASPKRYEAEFLFLFDTVTRVVGYSDSKEKFLQDVQAIKDELEVYHHLYDIYNDYEGINNLKTINDRAGKDPVPVDEKIIDLLLLSKEVHTLTGGEVNVAMGSVLSIWHRYRTEGIDNPDNAELPPMDLLLEADTHTDIDNLIINVQESTVYLSDPEMRLDVGAIAKGYATEQVSRYIEQTGVKSMLISVGGNVRSIGVKGDTGRPWVVGVQNPTPRKEHDELMQLNLSDMSLVTSGNYERYYVVDGVRYHHIIDAGTLMPSILYDAVTILCQDSGLADALSTAVFNMPFDQGQALIQSIDGAEALWVYGDGTLEYSTGFKDYVTN